MSDRTQLFRASAADIRRAKRAISDTIVSMKKTKGELIRTVVDRLVDGTNEAIDWFNDPHKYNQRLRGYLPQEEWDRLFGDTKRKTILRRLKKKKWIEDRRLGNGVTYSLSQNVLVEYLRNSIKQTTSIVHAGELLVAFDFPEAAGRARREWRRLLKSVGFKQIQLSVWSTVKSVEEQITQLVKLLGLQKWVKIYRGYELQ